MAELFRQKIRVEFADTDMAGIMHFSNFFRFMERTEHAFLRSAGFSVNMELDGVKYGWPRVHASCDFRQPLRFEEEAEVILSLREKKTKTITYEFSFRKQVEDEWKEIATGVFTVVCVIIDSTSGKMQAVAIPSVVAEKIAQISKTSQN